MEKIQQGKYVALAYDLYQVNDKGEKLVHQIEEDKPEALIFGLTPGVLPALAEAIHGLGVGDMFDFESDPEDAFGDYDPEQVLHLDREVFVIDGKFDSEMVRRGNAIPMMTPNGYRVMGTVIDVTDEAVVMDFNHPLAGKRVRYSGKVVEVRDATAAELNALHGHHCGCGCDHDHCGDDCDCHHDHHHDDCDCHHDHHHDDCDCHHCGDDCHHE